MDHALYFVPPPDDRVHLALAGNFRQVAAKGLQRWRFDFTLLFGNWFFLGFTGAGFLCRSKVRVQLLQNLLPGLLDVHVQVFEDTGGNAVALAQQAKQNVLCADISMVEGLGFFAGQREHFLHARSIGDVPDHLLVGSGADLFLDFHTNGFEVEPELLEDVDGHALAELNQAEQEMFGADEIMVKTVGFLPRQREHLLRPRREIVHCFFAHSLKCSYFSVSPAAAARGGSGLAIGRLTCRKRSRTISARSKSRSSAVSFSECCF